MADGERGGEVRYIGEVDASDDSMRRAVKQIAAKYDEVLFCYEAGPTGYGLHRLIRSLGFDCMVVAPSLIPRRPGDHVKNNRRDAIGLAKLLRAGELTSVWVPDKGHEAMRDLVRARAAAVETLRVHRQQVSALMLRHGRQFPRKTTWTRSYLRWLQEQKFDHPAHQIVLQEAVEAVRLSTERLERLGQNPIFFVRRHVSLGINRQVSGWRACPSQRRRSWSPYKSRTTNRRRRAQCRNLSRRRTASADGGHSPNSPKSFQPQADQ